MIHMLFLTLVLQSSRVFLNFMNKVANRLVLGFVWLMIILGVEKMIPNFQEKKKSLVSMVDLFSDDLGILIYGTAQF